MKERYTDDFFGKERTLCVFFFLKTNKAMSGIMIKESRKHFSYVDDKKTTCDLCNSKFAFSGDNSSLIYHAQNVHKLSDSTALASTHVSAPTSVERDASGRSVSKTSETTTL